jgi:hypothetical protein
MKGWIPWLVEVIALLFGAIFVNLLSNQVEVWMPSFARWVVRHLARTMGPRAARCEEEWLAHLDQTSGGLAQLYVALRMLEVPFRTFIENSRDTPSGLKSAIRERAGLFTVSIAGALLIASYPPVEGRLPAYAILIPLLIGCALCLDYPHKLSAVYGRLNYFGRVVVGGFVLPLIVYFPLVWGLIAPSPRPPKKGVIGRQIATRSTFVIFPSLPLDSDRRETMASNVRAADPVAARATPRTDFVTKREPVSTNKYGVLTVRPLPIFNFSELPAKPPAESPYDEGLLSARTLPFLSLSELPEISLPTQPLPPLVEIRVSAPAAPTNLRIIP